MRIDNQHKVAFFRLPPSKTVISGRVGPKGDACKLNEALTAEGAEVYRSKQIATFKARGAHIVIALTLNTTAEGDRALVGKHPATMFKDWIAEKSASGGKFFLNSEGT